MLQFIIFLSILIFFLFSLFVFYRNESAKKHLKSILDIIAYKAEQDQLSGQPWQWRFDAYEADIDIKLYRKLVFCFWKNKDSIINANKYVK